MRYIKYKTTITKVVDETIPDLDAVRAILVLLKDKELDCSMQLEEGPRMELVRILKVDQEQFTFMMVKNRSSLQRNAKISGIHTLEVYNIDSDTVRVKPEISRWMMIEPVAWMQGDENKT